MDFKQWVTGEGTKLEIMTSGTFDSPVYTDISDITTTMGETMNETLDTFNTLKSAITSSIKTALDPEWAFTTKGDKSHAALQALLALRWQTGQSAVTMVRITDTLTGEVVTFAATITGYSPTYETPTVVEVPWSIKPYDGTQVTVATAEEVAPTVDTYTPAHEATGVSLTSPLVLAFDETVLRGVGNVEIYDASDDSLVESINVQLSGVSIADDTVTVIRSVTLEASTEYYVKITPGAFTDAIGNAYAGITNGTTWSFTTTA
jgi:hypothetical protein